MQAFSSTSPLHVAATALLQRERARLPDLSGVVVLLPTLRAAPDFARALGRLSGAATLLLPRFTTLAAWSEEVALDAIEPDSRREARLYRALRDGKWFSGADLWQVSADLRRLADELTRQNVGLPASLEEFETRLAKAHAASANRAFRFEARLVHAMWGALAQGVPDGEAAYALRLARLAGQAAGPLYSAGLDDLAPGERAFFDAYAARQPVHALPVRAASPLRAALQRAWDGGEPLRERAARQRAEAPQSPLDGRFALFGASSLEEEAQAVDVKVRQWLVAGKSAIAVVVQDRLVARRARALLERASVLVEDETGWTLSTSSASTVVRRWLDALASRFYHQDVLDLVKSPFFLADWDASRRKAAIYRLERLIRRHGLVSHLKRYLDFARREDGMEDAILLLQRLWDAQAPLASRERLPLGAWLERLRQSLDALGIRQGLENDAAGRQLLNLLQRLGAELAADDTRCTLAEWKSWLGHQLEGATFRDAGIESPVVFTHLGNLPLRAFDAVLIAGADAAHLPGADATLAFFTPAVRAELGLPRREEALARLERELGDVIAATPAVFVTWQARQRGEPNALTPWFERLEVFHRLAYGGGLLDADMRRLIVQAQVEAEGERREAATLHSPSTVLAPSDVPQTLSVSAYASLIACPYLFFARHALRLAELDEVREDMEKRDYGDLVHAVLQRFHARHARLSGEDADALRAELEALSDAVFADALEASYLSRGWALRWKALIPAYLAWQMAREAAGWCVAECEAKREVPLELAAGRTLTLKGRLDRRDEKCGEAGEKAGAVLDYKTQSPKALKEKLRHPGEDVQLALYALLQGEDVAEAAFVGLDEAPVQAVALDGAPGEWAAAEKNRLRALFDAILDGAALPANGAEKTCAYCEMHGLCRKEHWDA